MPKSRGRWRWSRWFGGRVPTSPNGHRDPTEEGAGADTVCPRCGAPGPMPYLREHLNIQALSPIRLVVVRLVFTYCPLCGVVALDTSEPVGELAFPRDLADGGEVA